MTGVLVGIIASIVIAFGFYWLQRSQDRAQEARVRQREQQRQVRELARRLQDLGHSYLMMTDEALAAAVKHDPLPFPFGTEQELVRCVDICRELGAHARLRYLSHTLAEQWPASWKDLERTWLRYSSGTKPFGYGYWDRTEPVDPVNVDAIRGRLHYLVDRSDVVYERVGDEYIGPAWGIRRRLWLHRTS